MQSMNAWIWKGLSSFKEVNLINGRFLKEFWIVIKKANKTCNKSNKMLCLKLWVGGVACAVWLLNKKDN